MMNKSVVMVQPSQPPSSSDPIQFGGLLFGFLSALKTWRGATTLLLVLIAYDQCKASFSNLNIGGSLIFIVVYLKKKGSLVGPRFKIPLVGPFLQALYPNFEAYLLQWASGPLSCVGIFHKYVDPSSAFTI